MSSRQLAAMAGTRAGISYWRVARTLFLVGAVLASSAVLGSKGQSDEASPPTCTTGGATKGISVTVDTNTKTATFVCDTGINNVLPSPGETPLTKYYANKTLEDGEEELATFFGEGSQATIVTPQGDTGGKSTVELMLRKLPERMKIIYFGCSNKAASGEAGTLAVATVATGIQSQPMASAGGSGGSAIALGAGSRRLMVADSAPYEALRRSVGRKSPQDGTTAAQKCIVKVTVPADPSASSNHPNQLASRNFRSLSFSLSGGRVCHCTPGCYSPMRAACTVAKQNMDLEITNESKSVSFQCDTDIDNLTPEKSSDLIFDESCQEQVKLSEKLPSASLTKTNSGYTFSVEELPETAATFCYKCSAAAADRKEPPAEESTACNVKINVSAADLDSAASSVATTGSVPLLTSGLAISFVVLPVVF
uniref:SRS domain-containing protein n=1 Tax=Neospora caninum (strain Liverpool) TaxID=572307 RepID=F0JAX2_NEOCL|nr:SRS domain-containing protein [Neospora caninum Liverpool]CEL71238.1 TPA: SRS domain-containing protein [Neospora caninum Liverpool]